MPPARTAIPARSKRRPARSARKRRPARARRPARSKATGKTPVARGGKRAGPGPAIRLTAAPEKDPRFQQAIQKLNKSANQAASHPPAAKKVAEAQAAALAPPNEKLAGARANQTQAMQQAETKKPQSDAFITMLRAEIRKVMPKKVEGAADYMKGDDKQQLTQAMTSKIDQQKAEATGDLKATSDAPPDTTNVPGKEVTPLPAAPAASRPPAVGAAAAMPAPKPAADISLEQDKQKTAQVFKEAEVTPTQLQKAHDPRFDAALSAKQKADQFADQAPGKYQASEQKILTQAAAQAVAAEAKGLGAMQKTKGASADKVRQRQLSAKEKDEARRKAVTDHIQAIFDRTKANVDKKLENLESEVTGMFERGADAAVDRMKKYVENRFNDRYSGVSGKARKLKDWLLPLPDSVKAWFDQAHQVFLADLDALVVRVANLVELRLKEAKAEITRGQKEIRQYVDGLPADLRSVGQAAEKDMASRFAELRHSVDAKKNDLAQKLAQKYKDATEKGAKALQQLKDAHKSLYERVRDAIAEVVKVLREFRDKVVGMLKKGKATIDLIVADPIQFLKNLLNAIKLGISQFVKNIWTHLKAGFMAWLFGSLANAGIEAPADFSLPSLLKLVLQILGLTYARIRAKAVKIIGERNVAIIEKAFELLKALWEGGPAALWEKIKEFLSDLKETVINAIQEWIVTTIIKAAVTKLISMFNPVGAIIQAIITIYNVVMFLIERIRQIMAFVEAVINSVHQIATGAISTAANWIEKALARTVPLIIAFLARLLGITGITAKIVSIIKKIQAKVDRAVDKVIAKIVGGIGKLLGAGKATVAKVLEWWKKDKNIPGEDESHRFYIEGSENSADIKVASSPKRLDDFIQAMVSDPSVKNDADKQKAIAAIKPESKKVKDALTGLRKLGKKAPLAKKQPYIDDLNSGYEAIAKQLAIIFKGNDTGTKSKPLPLSWPKPAWHAYPPLYLLNKGSDKSPIWKITAKPLKGSDKNKLVKIYYPDKSKNQSGPGEGEAPSDLGKLGIVGDYRIEAGNKVGPLTNAETPGGKTINGLLEKYGWSASGEDMDGDHVMEIQFGGKDDLKNLWPLNAATNRGAGSKLSREKIPYGTGEVTVDWLKRAKLSKKEKEKGKFTFTITKVKT